MDDIQTTPPPAKKKRGRPPMPRQRLRQHTGHRFSPQTLRHATALAKRYQVPRTAIFEAALEHCYRAIQLGELSGRDMLRR